MRRTAWIYILSILLSALALSIAAFINRPTSNVSIWTFLVLMLLTTFMRLYQIIAPDHRSYEGSTIAYIAGILLLPFWLFLVQVVISQSIEWIWVRKHTPGSLRDWYLQPFNMAKCILGGGLAYGFESFVTQSYKIPSYFPDLAIIFLMLILYVAANQFFLGLALYLARGISFREAGILRDALLIEFPLACIGYVYFELYQRNAWSVIFTLAPIILIYQVFMLPKVQDEAMKELKRVNQNLTEANQSIKNLNNELFLALAKVFDLRDPYVGGHAAQVAVYAVAIAEAMHLPQEQFELVRQSAFLHDIGKLAIPEVILNKPGRLTETEYNFVKQHCDIGAELLSSIQGLQHLSEFIRYHHERWDGRGYPAGLAGEEIPLESRILNICDSVETMASDRPYHRGMSIKAIIDEVRRCAGTQFDPVISELFVNILEQHGSTIIVNSARSVTQQFAASVLANEDLYQNIFNWAQAHTGKS